MKKIEQQREQMNTLYQAYNKATTDIEEFIREILCGWVKENGGTVTLHECDVIWNGEDVTATQLMMCEDEKQLYITFEGANTCGEEAWAVVESDHNVWGPVIDAYFKQNEE